MTDDEKRAALINEIQAWRDAVLAHPEGSPERREFQNKMKLTEWKLKELGPPQHSLGVDIKLVPPEEPQE
ncbi:hypothetical protein QA640_45705 (plasmid) [Bradyrhizobium sp. CB82]|uniref:hypothetical protein n=1 Tax=Bradyrhizobium sp. CB82 TaxID=3039159 RepID=UPI0024B11F66|nr:hypothetical protein [Bradyrhizobium sp. CB82]WFU46060.1 hypothetical protein QA640_45705 [Bradyrhizobium sp. CB82]